MFTGESAGNSTVYYEVNNGFQNVLDKLENYVDLNALNASPADGNEPSILEVADSGGILIGDANDDILLGRQGNDQLSGGSGNDIIFGGGGFDLINGGEGHDIIYGGSDNIDWEVNGYSFNTSIPIDHLSTLPLHPAATGDHDAYTANDGLGSRIEYTVSGDGVTDDISFGVYSRKEVANMVVDEDRSVRSWCLYNYSGNWFSSS